MMEDGEQAGMKDIGNAWMRLNYYGSHIMTYEFIRKPGRRLCTISLRHQAQEDLGIILDIQDVILSDKEHDLIIFNKVEP